MTKFRTDVKLVFKNYIFLFHLLKFGVSTDSVGENICEISYDGGLNLSPVRILQVHPSIETCWCNTDLCNGSPLQQEPFATGPFATQINKF